jgi:Fe2+ transport system protein FeoA
MKSLKDVEPETMVVVKEITGGLDVKEHLEELGVKEGVELNVVATEPVHVHWGPISLAVGDQESVIARGWGDKIYVEKGEEMLPLLRLEEGDKGTVISIEGGKDFEGFLSEYGIMQGSELTFLRHIPDRTMVFTVEGAEMRMGEGQASKVFVTRDGKSIQINYLEEGEKAAVEKIVGGIHIKEKFEQLGLKEGAEITLLRKETPAPTPKRGTYILAKVGEQLITIGHGLAEKVLVD